MGVLLRTFSPLGRLFSEPFKGGSVSETRSDEAIFDLE
jgi:hypothetical protein